MVNVSGGVNGSGGGGNYIRMMESSTLKLDAGTNTGAIQFQGQYLTSSDFVYQVFLPDGRPLQDSSGNPSLPCRLRLVGGVSGSGGVTLTGAKDSSGQSANYYDIIINDATGCTKVSLPGSI